MPALFVVAAVAQEVEGLRRAFPFERTASGWWETTVDSTPVRLVLTGVGFARARRAAREIADRARPGDFVLSTGFCGALIPTLERFRIAVSDSVITAGTDRVPAAVRIESTLLVPGGDPPIARVRSLTTPRIVNDPAERDRLHRDHGADVVDMESGILVETCRAGGIACGIARVVLDTPANPLRVDYNSIPAPRDDLRPWDVVRWLARRPWKLFALLADRRAAKAAAAALGVFLERVVRAFSASVRNSG